MSLFDAQSFLSQTLDEASATKSIPAPQAQGVPAQIIGIEVPNGIIKEGPNAGKPWYRLEYKVEITDPEYLAKWKAAGIESDKCTLRDGFLLDVNEGGGIAMGPGRNVALGRLREATGTNQPGKSIMDMVGRMIRIDVKHAVSEKTGDPYATPTNPTKY